MLVPFFYFQDMKAHVINLAKRTDRWKRFVASAEETGIDYIRFEAIEPSEEDLKAWRHSPGLLGCNLSHKKLWQDFLQTDEPYLFVLEDDARQIEEWDGKMPKEFDILYLGGNAKTYAKDNMRRHDVWRVARRVLTTHAYIISRAGAEKALKTPLHKEAVDVALWDVQAEGKSYYYDPSLFIQNPDYSDILNRQVDYRGMI